MSLSELEREQEQKKIKSAESELQANLAVKDLLNNYGARIKEIKII